MKKALELALLGEGHTSPNPLVGAVIVKDGKIIAQGYHEKYGREHAERNALKNCLEDPEGAEMYVTLEPCCHYGKQPPCTDAIIRAGIKKVYVGSDDPNPKVSGGGIKILKNHGISVETGVLKDECDKINEIFMHYIKEKQPFIALKYAMTLDGKISTKSGDSKWISNEKSREHVHKLRKKYSSILVGINTVIADDPMLNCRIEKGVDPVRIICDSSLKISPYTNIVKSAKDIPTIIAYCNENEEKANLLKESGIELIKVGKTKNGIDLKELFTEIGQTGIDSVLVEGGAMIHASLLEGNLVDRVYAYIAPKIIGGRKAAGPIGGSGIEKMSRALVLSDTERKEFDGDIFISGRVKRKE